MNMPAKKYFEKNYLRDKKKYILNTTLGHKYFQDKI